MGELASLMVYRMRLIIVVITIPIITHALKDKSCSSQSASTMAGLTSLSACYSLPRPSERALSQPGRSVQACSRDPSTKTASRRGRPIAEPRRWRSSSSKRRSGTVRTCLELHPILSRPACVALLQCRVHYLYICMVTKCRALKLLKGIHTGNEKQQSSNGNTIGRSQTVQRLNFCCHCSVIKLSVQQLQLQMFCLVPYYDTTINNNCVLHP